MSVPSIKSSVYSEFKSIAIIILIAVFVRIFVIELFYVPTGSMKLTILEGDYIFSTKYTYGYSKYSIPFSPNIFSGRIFAESPEVGDIVITKSAHKMSTTFIKRLIGLPGDTIQIINDITYINAIPVGRIEVGEFKDEFGNEFIKFKETLPNGVTFFSYKHKTEFEHNYDQSNFGPYFVPQGHYFLLGDNRDDSGDSRFQVGFVPFEYLIAKGRFVIFSTENPLWNPSLGFVDQIINIGRWFSGIRFTRIFKNLYEEN